MYTVMAKTTFEEMIKGTITPNKVADLVILNGDLANFLDEINTLVEMTTLTGEIANGLSQLHLFK
jgi:predicted amidohydrolase YtcJ